MVIQLQYQNKVVMQCNADGGGDKDDCGNGGGGGTNDGLGGAN